MIRYAKLPLIFDAKATQSELLSVDKNWQSHFNTYHFEGSWTVLALRSPDGSHTNIVPELMASSEYRDTLFMEQFLIHSLITQRPTHSSLALIISLTKIQV